LLKKRRNREWAEVREKEQSIKEPKSSAPASAAPNQVASQTVAGKLSAYQIIPKPSLPSGGFVKGMFHADNSTVHQFITTTFKGAKSLLKLAFQQVKVLCSPENTLTEGPLQPRDALFQR